MTLTTTSFTKCIELPTSQIHTYINEHREIFIIRPTDATDHPNSTMYDIGYELLNICDLQLPEDHEEIAFSFRLLYDVEDPIDRVGKIIIQTVDRSDIILMPVYGKIDPTPRSRRDTISIIFMLRPVSAVSHEIIEQS